MNSHIEHLNFDQFSGLAIHLNIFMFLANNLKTNLKFEKNINFQSVSNLVELVKKNLLIYITLILDQYSRLSNHLNIFSFWQIIKKLIRNLKKASHMFAELVKKNLLM